MLKKIQLSILLISALFICAGKGPGHRVVEKVYPKVPSSYNVRIPCKLTWHRGEISLIMYARRFAQGNAVYIEIYPALKKIISKNHITCLYGNKKVYITQRDWGFRGFFAISPEERHGRKVLKIIVKHDKKTIENMFYFHVRKVYFPIYRRRLNLGRYSNITYEKQKWVVELIKKNKKVKKAVFMEMMPDMIRNSLSHPRDMHRITSPFWSRRVCTVYKMRRGRKIYLKPTVHIHQGLDLRGLKGDRVFAIADGVIVIAEKMYYEGNFTVINHGNRIFSYYMHQNSIAVRPGQLVRGGDIIGRVGSTGSSTASHLHVSLLINGIQVDPLSILPFPIRK